MVPSKKPLNSSNRPGLVKMVQKTLEPLRHGKGKGLMTANGLNVPPLVPLLVKNRDIAMEKVQSLVKNEDLNEFSEHKMEAFGNAGLLALMRVSRI
nr:hypothetical protein CFP56_47025 [Quercus suber]